MKRSTVLVFTLTLALTLTLTVGAQGASDAPDGTREVATFSSRSSDNVPKNAPHIEVLSNRADLVSGGDALVEVVVPARVHASSLTVKLNGQDVTSAFDIRADGRFLGLVDGLALGTNVLEARSTKMPHGARIDITNHAIGGPIFSGPQRQPWVCATVNAGLGPAVDEQCNAAAPVNQFFYRRTTGQFTAYDPDAPPPADLSTTTTAAGLTVPYIVRQETGTQNRGIYRIAVLFDPTEPWEPWEPQAAWEQKLLYPFGASCGTAHSQGNAPNVLNHDALSRGFMVAQSSMNALGHNCNTVVSAESVMMLKEHIIENYGEIRYTMSQGGSGGAISQHEVANAYPGLLQGLRPSASYEDMLSGALYEAQDCRLLHLAINEVAPELGIGTDERTAVTGMLGGTSCLSWHNSFAGFNNPATGCAGLPASQRYNAVTNPTGCRGTFSDYSVAIFGTRPPELWTTAAEQAAGGFAKQLYDNVGVQYGLTALQEGVITAEKFVGINEKIGGYDIDHNLTAARTRADPDAVRIAYRSGRTQDASQLDQAAIIDLRNTANNFNIHTDHHSWANRDRMKNANGHADNQIIWTSGGGNGPGPSNASSLDLLDQWLAAVEADHSNAPLEVKIRRNKPADASDACFIGGERVTDTEVCAETFPYFANPRIAAGAPSSNDVMQCRLKKLHRNSPDYGSSTFTDEQWARLEAVFPDGVCNWTHRGTDQVSSVPWLTYKNGPGGEPLGKPPASARF